MLARLFRSDTTSGIRYVILAGIVVALFAVGYVIGNIVTTVWQAGTPAAEDSGGPTAGARVDPPHLLSNFTLTSQTGAPISLHDLRGRAAVLFFGYTHCPEECPTTMANFKRIKQMLGDQANQAAFVFISVDGKRDTPQQLTSFIDQFDSAFIGMTGDETLLRQIGSEYGLVFSQDGITAPAVSDDDHEHAEALDQQHYFVQHTSPAFLIDRDGYLRMVYFYGTEPAAIADGIRELLR